MFVIDLYEMDTKIKAILLLLAFPQPIEEALLQYYASHMRQLPGLSEMAYAGQAPNFPLLKRRPLTRLAVVTYLLIGRYTQYQALGADERIIRESFRDLRLRAELYYEKTKKIGINQDDVIWLRHLMNGSIFKIGVLQFQKFEMIYLDEDFLGEAYMHFSEEQKAKLPAGTPVINVHIQRGASLEREGVQKSFADARECFRRFFPQTDFKAFLCYSWILYPPLRALLGSDSRRAQFAQSFSIIGACADKTQAIENIFGQRYRKKQDYPQNSSLQRLALARSKCLGMACGVMDLG